MYRRMAGSSRGTPWRIGYGLDAIYVLESIFGGGGLDCRDSSVPHAFQAQAPVMATNVNEKIRKLDRARRKKVEVRASELIAEEMTLRDLRKVRNLTQVRLAKTLGITQDSVSRLEKRSDLLLSTLRKTVEAMGGKLSLVAEFPDRPPVVLSGIAGDDVDS